MNSANSFTRKKVLFLYSELAGYMIACLDRLVEKYDADIFVVSWPVNKEAPFRFDFSDRIQYKSRDQFTNHTLQEYVMKIKPDLIYVSGWIDKGYLKVTKKLKNEIPVLMGLDNKWTGNSRQIINSIMSFAKVKPYCTHLWVPGELQERYALKLGFLKQNIYRGLYSADVDSFNTYYEKYKLIKLHKFPHRFIYVGRYYDFKGIEDLWNAFIRFKRNSQNDWELWCFGVGDISPVKHPSIRHFGFVQPAEMGNYIAQTGVFVIPSRIEPWGVVLHEFAAAGFPLIASNEVGASGEFIIQNENGFLFNSRDVKSLENILHTIAGMKDEDLNKMGKMSVEISKKITPDTWADTINEIMNK